VTAIWPPSGIALSVLLLRGKRVWPGIFLGAFVSNALNHEPIYVAAGIAAGNTLGPFLGAYCLRRFVQFDVSLHRLRDVLGLALIGSALAMVVTATNGVANLVLAGILSWSDAPSVWLTWWIGDAMGVLLIAPPLLAWFAHRHFDWAFPKLSELTLAAIALYGVTAHIFFANAPVAFLIFPPVIWISLRFGPRESAVAVLAVSAVAVWRTSYGTGPFGSGSMDGRLGTVVAFMSVLSMTALTLAALAAERRQAELSLRHANDELEARVLDRTAEIAEVNTKLILINTEFEARTTELAQSETRFRGAFETAAHGFALLSPDGRWLQANAALCQMVGYTEAELLMTDFQTLTHPDDLEADLDHARALLAGEIETYQMEKRYFHKNGSIILILLSVSLVRAPDGSPLQFVSQIDNITDRKLAEQALRAQEDQYRLLATHAADAVFRLDLDGMCLYASPSARDLIGFEPDYLVGKNILTRFHPDDAKYVSRMHRDLARGNTERAIVTYRSEPLDQPGTWVWLEANCGLVRDPTSSAPMEIIASIRDISERKALEVQLESARRSAEEIGAAKSTFLANISHEIRTPMSGILGMLELLRSAPNDGERRHLLEGLDQSARMLTTVLDDILDFSKMESGQPLIEVTDIDLRNLLNTTFNLFALPASNQKLSLSYSFPNDINPSVRGDPARLRQIIANLLNNAIKFTSEGRIELRVSVTAAPNAEQKWRFEVSDTGIGIEQEMIGAVFSPFFQGDPSTTRRFGGSGLGLAICRRLVEAMGGEIGVESEPAKGSLFWFEVPLAKSGILPSKKIKASNTDPHDGRPIKILLAEDNPINQYMVSELLRRMGHLVMGATNGLAAIKAYASEHFDLVLMDMQMPEMDGPESAAAIRSLGGEAEHVPIIALTADPSVQYTLPYQAARIDALLTKPIDTAKLAQAIRSAGIASADRSENNRSVPGNSAALLDMNTLSKVAQALGIDQLDQLLSLLSADVEERSLAIGNMIHCGDERAAKRSAHALCGAALPLGAMKLAEAARKFQIGTESPAHLAEKLLDISGQTICAINEYRHAQQARQKG
jgi:PAS domain S-box-containing protein